MDTFINCYKAITQLVTWPKQQRPISNKLLQNVICRQLYDC